VIRKIIIKKNGRVAWTSASQIRHFWSVNSQKNMYVEVCLPYYKQGDDLAHCLEGATPYEALLKHADMMNDTKNILLQIAEVIKEDNIEIEADTHHIGLTVSEAIANLLVEKELAYVSEYLDEEEQ